MLFTLCRECADKLQIRESLLPALSVRPCAGCGTLIGHQFRPAMYGTQKVMWPAELVAPYVHIWQWWAWPIAWGIALQDNYGTHEHEWSTTYESYVDGVRRRTCRCKEQVMEKKTEAGAWERRA
jgi:hypothetical protein